MRSTLASREDGIVDALLNVRLLILAEEDETSTGTTKSLVAVSDRVPVQLANSEKETCEELTWWCRRHRSTRKDHFELEQRRDQRCGPCPS